MTFFIADRQYIFVNTVSIWQSFIHFALICSSSRRSNLSSSSYGLSITSTPWTTDILRINQYMHNGIFSLNSLQARNSILIISFTLSYENISETQDIALFGLEVLRYLQEVLVFVSEYLSSQLFFTQAFRCWS